MEKETLKTIEEHVSALEAGAERLRQQAVSLAKWVKDIRWKVADLFRTDIEPFAELDSIISGDPVPVENGSRGAKLWWVQGVLMGEWEFLSRISYWTLALDKKFSALAGKQALLPEDSDAKEIPGLAAMTPVREGDPVGTVAERIALLELAADMVQAKIATLTESIQGIHFRAAAFWGIDPSLFFSFQPTAQEIAGIEARTGLRLFPPKQKTGFPGWLARIFGKGAS